MIFIPKKLRILPLSVAVITALSCSTSVFAASYVTTTTYTGTSTVTVSSTISGAEADEQITYLVHKGTPVTEGNIVYIDQDAASSTGSASFKFTTSHLNLSATTSIKFGAENTPTNEITATETNKILNLTNPRIMSLSDTVLKSVIGSNNANNSLITFGTIAGGEATDFCGILFSEDASATTGIAKEFTATELGLLVTNSGTVKKFPALGRNGLYGTDANHQFAIKLVDGGSGFLKSSTATIPVMTYYTRAYGIYNGTVTLGDVKTVTFEATNYTTLN